MPNSLQREKCIYLILGSIFYFLTNSTICNAQLNASLFEDFSQTVFNPYLINPSATDTSYRYFVRANNANELGLVRNVQRFYIDGDKKFDSKQKNTYHFGGFQLSNSKLGDYIYKSRLQLRYAFYSQISKKSFMSTGVSLGFINYAFLTTQGGTGGSDLAPDGMIGISYSRPKTTVGVAIQQLFTSIVTPVNQSFELNRLYNIHFERIFDLSPTLAITSQTVIQFSENQQAMYNQSILTSFYDHYLVGISNFSSRKTSVSLGLNEIQLFNSQTSIIVSYSLFHSMFPRPDNSLEIFIGFRK